MDIPNTPTMNLHQADNPISEDFFDLKNIIGLQKQLQERVRRETGLNIDRQSVDDMLVIMRGIYASTLLNPGADVDRQVRELNEAVLRVIVPQALSSVQAVLRYHKDTTEAWQPLDRGVLATSKGDNSLELPALLG